MKPVSLRRPIVFLLIVSLMFSSGCSGWRTVSRDEMVRDVRGHKTAKVRVLYPDSTLEISNPSVRTDSLVGTAKLRGARRPISIPLAEVDSVAVHRDAARKHARGATISLMVFALVLFLFSGFDSRI